MPNTHSRSAAASSHRYTPYASVPSIPANPLDELDFTPSTSTMPLEEYQFLMASVTGNTSKGVVDAEAFRSSPVSYVGAYKAQIALPEWKVRLLDTTCAHENRPRPDGQAPHSN